MPGDGIGPEVAEAARRAVDATGVKIEWECVQLSDTGEIPREVIDSLERTRVGLKGPTTTPVASGHVSLNVQLRNSYLQHPLLHAAYADHPAQD